MSDLAKDIHIDLILPDSKAVNHKKAYQILAREVSNLAHLPAILLFDRLIDKEKAMPSSIGEGVAIPHLQIRSLEKPCAALMTLQRGIKLDTPDSRPVDLICLLLSPERDGPLHLRRLSRLSRLLKNNALKQKIMDSSDADAIRMMLAAPEGWMMAA